MKNRLQTLFRGVTNFRFSWFAGFSFLLHLALVAYVMKDSSGIQAQVDRNLVQVEIVDLQKYIVIPKGAKKDIQQKTDQKVRQIPQIHEEEIISSFEQQNDSRSTVEGGEGPSSEELLKIRELAEASYQQKLQSMIEQKKFYPFMSHEMKESGQVTILFSLKEDGSIDQIFVDQASEYERLNRAALKAVQKAAPFGAPPEGRKTFVVTLHFILDDRWSKESIFR